MDVTARRVLAGSTAMALVLPWVMVLAAAVHLAVDHDHGLAADVAARAGDAWHGHAHAVGTAPHEHQGAPTETKFRGPSVVSTATAPLAVVLTRPTVPESALRLVHRPEPPTESPPVLRV